MYQSFLQTVISKPRSFHLLQATCGAAGATPLTPGFSLAMFVPLSSILQKLVQINTTDNKEFEKR